MLDIPLSAYRQVVCLSSGNGIRSLWRGLVSQHCGLPLVSHQSRRLQALSLLNKQSLILILRTWVQDYLICLNAPVLAFHLLYNPIQLLSPKDVTLAYSKIECLPNCEFSLVKVWGSPPPAPDIYTARNRERDDVSFFSHCLSSIFKTCTFFSGKRESAFFAWLSVAMYRSGLSRKLQLL